ncbi:hypothetical protein [Rubellicoccus peritrichatus]|uniref:Uncharacterized protein n=1 Tax=Rubellicoccus peritrichatus TaxID=3080537 RepID=A0AAQ3LHB1_9BACT|nr:hypothetical protein [Puniceicoccus sp. CR14]WOO42124.1 hypothetical protein RZN69_03420 [Puniceicoccus sp. CR14]
MKKASYLTLIPLISTLSCLQSHAQLWSNTSGEPAGWKYSDWFGFFWSPSQESGWLYHETLGWLYAEGDSQADIEIYTTDLVWLYTNESIYPVFYSYSKDDWLNYVTADNPENPYWYSYSEEVFIARSTLAIGFATADSLSSGEDGSFDAQRSYFWQLWTFITEVDNNNVPFFETWFTRDEVFSESGIDSGANLHTARQNQYADARSHGAPGSITSLFFNEAAADFIRSNRYNYEQTFIDLSEQYEEENVAISDRNLSFPSSSIGLKPIWFPILNQSASTYRILPVWNGDPQYPVTDETPDATNPPLPNSDNSILGFKTAVLVDVSGDEVSDDTTETISWNGDDDYSADVVSINDFYYKVITEESLSDAYDALEDQYPDIAEELAVGDYLLLVGMHMLPHAELKTYSTLWWHTDPDVGRYASLRPDSVKGVFRNYIMDVTFDVGDSNEYDGTAHVIFNPYLEAYSAGGVASNCLYCHSYAAYGASVPSPAPRAEATASSDGDSDSDSDSSTVGLDGWWSLEFETISADDSDD